LIIEIPIALSFLPYSTNKANSEQSLRAVMESDISKKYLTGY